MRRATRLRPWPPAARRPRRLCRALGEALREQPPRSLLTVARGSSDHAAQYMAYLIMARLGRLVTSMPMSLVTLYQSRRSLRRAGLARLFRNPARAPTWWADEVLPCRRRAHLSPSSTTRLAAGAGGAVGVPAACRRRAERGRHQELHRAAGGRRAGGRRLAGRRRRCRPLCSNCRRRWNALRTWTGVRRRGPARTPTACS
jgi:hypothetical protein